jgi:hypothetical protein
MNAIARHLAGGLAVTYRCRIGPVEHSAGAIRLCSDDGVDRGLFDTVVVSAPPAQAAELVAGVAPGLAARVRAVSMAPCWAVMMAVDVRLEVEFDGTFINTGPLSWAARNSSKRGRAELPETWVLHGSPEWSTENLERDPAWVAERLLTAFRELLPAPVVPRHVRAHRWRYALPIDSLAEDCLIGASQNVVVCGDWCGGPRLEGAYLSGRAAAGQILRSLGVSEHDGETV